jgi:riboflavin transporter FmnP
VVLPRGFLLIFPLFGGKMDKKTEFFTAKRVAILGTMTAAAYLLTLVSFPIFPVVPFLKLDFSFAVMLLAGYILGPLSAAIMAIVVNLLGAIGSLGGITGAIANTSTALVFVVLPTLVYKWKKGFKWVVIVLTVCSILEIFVALVTNRFINYPLYYKDLAKAQFELQFWFLVAFNAIKCVSNGLITILLYKRLKNLLGKFL